MAISMKSKAQITLLIFVLAYFGVFLVLRMPCFSTRCVDKYIPELDIMWLLTGLYFLSTASLLVYSHTRPVNVKIQWSLFPSFHPLIIANALLLGTLLVSHFVIFKSKLTLVLTGNPAKTRDWLPGGIEWRSTMFASAHMCDILLALTLLPISRRSFLPRYLNISPTAAVRFHQATGTLLVFAGLFHGLSYFMFQSKNTVFDFAKDVLLIGKEWAYKNFNVPLGILTLTLIVTMRLAALPFVRRQSYQTFLLIHYCLIIPVVVLASIHAASNFYWSIPSLVLYGFDLVFRLAHYKKPLRAAADIEPSGIIRLDVFGVDKSTEPGQFFLVTLPAISLIAHPFSVVSCEKDRVQFIIRPFLNGQWTHKFYDRIIPEINMNCVLDGPFGVRPFDFEQIKGVVCIVGGTGISASIMLIKRALDCGKQCHLIWSIRDADMILLSPFQELLEQYGGHFQVDAYITGGGSESLPSISNLKYHQGRMQPYNVFAEIFSESYVLDYAGVYTCGPQSLMDDVESCSKKYPNAILFKETFEW